MAFLELRKDKVEWTEEALAQKELSQFLSIAKKKDPELFQDAATYIYWAYKKDGLYSNQLPTSRKEETCARHLQNRKWTDFENIPVVKQIIDLYVKYSFTVMEMMYEKMKKDIEELFEYYSNIPWTKKLKVRVRVPVPDGEDQYVETLVDFSNAEEKTKALKQADTIIDYEEKLRLKIFKETKDKRRSQALFDRS